MGRNSLSVALLVSLGIVGMCLDARAQNAGVFVEHKFVAPTISELGRAFPNTRPSRTDIIADRLEYMADEMHGQFLVLLFSKYSGDRI